MSTSVCRVRYCRFPIPSVTLFSLFDSTDLFFLYLLLRSFCWLTRSSKKSKYAATFTLITFAATSPPSPKANQKIEEPRFEPRLLHDGPVSCSIVLEGQACGEDQQTPRTRPRGHPQVFRSEAMTESPVLFRY
jgi:hypothetical protein